MLLREAADLVADFGRECGTIHVECDVVDHVDVAAVIDESPSRAADDDASRDRGRIAVFDEAVAMKVDGIAGTRIGSRARLQLPIGVDHRSLIGRLLSVRPSW